MKQTSQQIKNLFLISFIAICCFFLATFLLFFRNRLLSKHISPHTMMITREETNITNGNQPFLVVGINDYDLAYKSNDQINQTFTLLHNAGINTIRFWLFGDGISDGFQPSPGMYNEARFKQADYVFFEAKKYNMKLIPVLVNNWKDYGGKEQYIQWFNQTDETAFYTNRNVTSLFEKYIAYILTRKNIYTHIPYKNDSTIFGWDIMNEPRSTNQHEMNSWLVAMASFIKTIDPNHLVFAGTENATVTDFKPSDVGKSSNLCDNSAIDICSVHLYLFNNSQPLYISYSDVTKFIEQQSDYAKRVNKPLLMEEFGIASDTKPFGQDQLFVMKQLMQKTKSAGYAGFLIWDWSNMTNSLFTFSQNGDAQGHYSLTDLETIIH